MAGPKRAQLRIGTSGYQYDHWRGVFYPEDIRKTEWFTYYAQRFDTVEINNTFYNLPDAGTFDNWREQTPDGFRYALKFSRYGTHMKKLKDPGGTINLFIERASRLGDFLGPILVQLPPHWRVNVNRLRAFLDAAPTDYRWAVEFRDPSWLCDETYECLREHNAALCVHDMIDNHPEVITADWVYRRFHGDNYGGSYSHQFLSSVAKRIAGYIDDGLDVFAYFNNDAEGYAVSNAVDLKRFVLELT